MDKYQGSVEVEVKARVDDLETARRRLFKQGARQVTEIHQIDRYFDHPCRSFKDTDEAVRVRTEAGETVLTYKGPKMDEETKTRHETEVQIGSADDAVELLESLGFTPAPLVEKNRQVYELGEVTVCLDRVEDVGTYVELEQVTDPSEVDEARERLIEVAEELELTDLERRSYLELLIGGDPAGS